MSLGKTIDELKEDICEVGRRLYQHGFIAAGEGNVSIRLSDNELMGTPAGTCKGYLTPDMISTCDMEGNTLTGPRISTEIQMHISVYKARPDVNACVHIHEESSIAVSTLKDGLLPLTQDAIFLYDRVAYHDYQGITEDAAERDEIVANLGDKPAMLMRSHGSVTVGAEMRIAYMFTCHLVKASEIQLQLMAAGGELVVPPAAVCRHAAEQYEAHLRGRGQDNWPALLRDLDRLDDSYRT